METGRTVITIIICNFVKQVAFHGLTGRIQFKEGTRSNIKWDLLKLRQTELDKVGEWTSTEGLNVTKPEAFHEFGDANITLKVTTIEVSNDSFFSTLCLLFRRFLHYFLF